MLRRKLQQHDINVRTSRSNSVGSEKTETKDGKQKHSKLKWSWFKSLSALFVLLYSIHGFLYYDHSTFKEKKSTSVNTYTNQESVVSVMESTNDKINEESVVSVVMIHYHKSGHRFSIQLEETLGEQGVFGGSRSTRAFFEKRRHYEPNMCSSIDYGPNENIRSQSFEEESVIIRAEAPDIFADDCVQKMISSASLASQKLISSASPPPIKMKIIHFVRDPIDMAISHFLYHTQDPTPEQYIYHLNNPCKFNEKSMNYILNDALGNVISKHSILNVQQMCRNYFRNTRVEKHHVKKFHNVRNSLYDVLVALPSKHDQLRLMTAQFLLSKDDKAGTDLLRMVNNMKQLRLWRNEQQQQPQQEMTQIMFVSMDQITNDKEQTLLNILDFLEINNDPKNNNNRIERILESMNSVKLNKKEDKGLFTHVTTDLVNEQEREELVRFLKEDEVLGPVMTKLKEIYDEELTLFSKSERVYNRLWWKIFHLLK